MAPKFFTTALSSTEDVDTKRKVMLLNDKYWFEIAIVYDSGNWVLLAIEKRADGERAFKDAFVA
ncbi:MAG TPA: hypothetical protein VMM15_23420 [Bradyrhizobium sp.]|nr:hypothetical protein [Bradyrhizobium sp.]